MTEPLCVCVCVCVYVCVCVCVGGCTPLWDLGLTVNGVCRGVKTAICPEKNLGRVRHAKKHLSAHSCTQIHTDICVAQKQEG